MKAHTKEFKTEIKEFGREIDSIITYTIDNEVIELGADELNSVTPRYEGAILKSVMKELEIDSNVEIPIGTILNYQFGVKTRDDIVEDYKQNYDYVNFGNYIVKEVEKKEDTESYLIKCYDKMLYSMVDYESMNITYPITIRDYMSAICNHLNLTFKNANDTFANYDKEIQNELYFTTDGGNMDYTFRDVLDELAQVTASTICINEDDDELEIRYINDTLNNLIDVSTIEQKTENGITCSYDENTQEITLNGTCTATTYFDFGDTFASYRNGGNYIPQITAYYYGGSITGSATLDDGNNEILLANLNEENNILSIRPARVQQTNYFGFTFNNGDIADNFKLKVMVNNDVLDKYEIRDTINEEYLKDTNINFNVKYGPVNTIVLSRSAESDNIYYPEILPQNPVEIKIVDNQIMNFDNRDEFLPDIYNKLNGLEFYSCNYESTGICYYNLCDKYDVNITRTDEETSEEINTTYTCIMFNDEVLVTQDLSENIHADIPEQSVTEYQYADTTDKRINRTTLIVNKQEQQIQGVVEQIGDRSSKSTTITQDIDGLTSVFTRTGGTNLFYNTGLHFKDEEGNFTYWTVEPVDPDTDYLGVVNDSESLSGTNMVLPRGKTSQTINIVPGTYSFSLKYKQNIATATCSVKINDKTITFEDNTEWEEIDTQEQQLEITNNTLTIEFECNVQGGYYIKELMLNRGADAIEYTQNINETRTDTVQISDGIVVSSSSTNTVSRHDSDGFRILKKDNNDIVLRATENGTETTSIKASGNSEIAGLLIKINNGHTLLSGKGGN